MIDKSKVRGAWAAPGPSPTPTPSSRLAHLVPLYAFHAVRHTLLTLTLTLALTLTLTLAAPHDPHCPPYAYHWPLNLTGRENEHSLPLTLTLTLPLTLTLALTPHPNPLGGGHE